LPRLGIALAKLLDVEKAFGCDGLHFAPSALVSERRRRKLKIT